MWDSGLSANKLRRLQLQVLMNENTEGTVMAQTIVSWFICDGRYRVHAIDAVGRHRARIVEIEDVDTSERFHGTPRRLERLFLALGSAGEPVHVALVGRTQTR